MKPLTESPLFLHPRYEFLHEFKVQGRRVTFIGETGEWTHLLGGIPLAAQNSFAIKILKTQMGRLGIGAIDGSLKEERNCDYRQPFLIRYSSSGQIIGDGKGLIKTNLKGYQ